MIIILFFICYVAAPQPTLNLIDVKHCMLSNFNGDIDLSGDYNERYFSD